MTALKMRKANKSVHFLHFRSYCTRLSPIFQQGNRNLHHIKDHVVICSWMKWEMLQLCFCDFMSCGCVDTLQVSYFTEQLSEV